MTVPVLEVISGKFNVIEVCRPGRKNYAENYVFKHIICVVYGLCQT
jgi:hypothetical protein